MFIVMIFSPTEKCYVKNILTESQTFISLLSIESGSRYENHVHFFIRRRLTFWSHVTILQQNVSV